MAEQLASTVPIEDALPDKNVARAFFEGRRWCDGVHCPACDESERITVRKGGYYRCNACRRDFTVRTGTILERSHIPLNKWLQAMHLLASAQNRVSSVQLSKRLGITQKSAWSMLQRLREACGDDLIERRESE